MYSEEIISNNLIKLPGRLGLSPTVHVGGFMKQLTSTKTPIHLFNIKKLAHKSHKDVGPPCWTINYKDPALPVSRLFLPVLLRPAPINTFLSNYSSNIIKQ